MKSHHIGARTNFSACTAGRHRYIDRDREREGERERERERELAVDLDRNADGGATDTVSRHQGSSRRLCWWDSGLVRTSFNT